MKTPRQKTGALGESYARQHLKTLGYRILETNWRRRRAEIDIIAKDGEVLVFVEVKTLTNDYLGGPTSRLTPRQQSLISSAAGDYMRQSGHEWEIRFDLIGVFIEETGDYKLEHVKDAFFPGL